MASQEHLGATLVLGLGRTGEATARYLASLLGTRVDSVTLYGGASSQESDRTRALEELGVRVVCGTEEVEGDYDLAVASPGIPVDAPFFRSAAARSREVVGEPELAFRESPERWVAITGTNGKTTTTSLAAHLLRAGGLDAQSVGNIGTPPVEALTSRAEGSWFVAELSSFQLATTRLFRPRVAVLLNVTPDHLEWHHTMEAYAEAKERAFANLGVGDLAVVSVDDEWCRAVADRCEGRGLRVCRLSVAGEPDGPCAAFLREGTLVVRLDGAEHELVAASDLKIFGLHNAENALAAAAVALELGAGEKDVRSGLVSFQPIEHRIEPAGEVAGVRYVNDSKATNTDSVEKALTAFEAGSVVVLLGGHDKMTDLTSLADAVCARCRAAVCFGDAGERIAAALERARAASGAPLEVLRAPHLREAFDAELYKRYKTFKFKRILPGAIILLIAFQLFYAQLYVPKVSSGEWGSEQNRMQLAQIDNSTNVFMMLLSARADFYVSYLAFMDKPLWGHGSWAMDKNLKYARIQANLFHEEGTSKAGVNMGVKHEVPMHSVVMGMGTRNGIFAFLVFLVIFIIMYYIGFKALFPESPYNVFLIYTLVGSFQHLMFGPISTLKNNGSLVFAIFFTLYCLKRLYYKKKNEIQIVGCHGGI